MELDKKELEILKLKASLYDYMMEKSEMIDVINAKDAFITKVATSVFGDTGEQVTYDSIIEKIIEHKEGFNTSKIDTSFGEVPPSQNGHIVDVERTEEFTEGEFTDVEPNYVNQ